MATGLTFQVTGLFYPGDTVPAFFGQIADPTAGFVEIPLNDSRHASVTFRAPGNEQLAGDALNNTYYWNLKVYYRDLLVFWGPINLAEGNFTEETVTLTATDPSIRLIHHFLRRGDLGGDLNADNNDNATVTVDHVGLRLLRDAGLNTSGQTTRGVPDLGIVDGTNDFTEAPDLLMGVSRGDPVWSTMQQLAASLGPDFELEPIDDTAGAYCQLNTYDHQGSDVSDAVAFHYGTGKDNLDGLSCTAGSKFITHAHVLARDGLYRVTRANEQTSLFNGIYVWWDATDFDGKKAGKTATEAVLAQHAEDILQAYSEPLLTVDLTLPVETDASYVYGTDYKVGDTVSVAGRAGGASLPEYGYRITQVRLDHDATSGSVKPSVQVVADKVDDDLSSTEEG